MYNFFSNWCWFCTLGCAFKSLRFRLSALSRFSCKRIWIDHKTSSFGALWKILSLNAKIISNFYKRSSLYSPHWGKNSQFTQNFTFWKSHSQSVNFHKSHIFKVWFFTKFTFFKHQSPRTFCIKSWICPSTQCACINILILECQILKSTNVARFAHKVSNLRGFLNFDLFNKGTSLRSLNNLTLKLQRAT